jgi:hypothetical protein
MKIKWKYLYIKYDTVISSGGTLNVNTRLDQAANFTSQGQDITLSGMSPGLGPTGSFTLGTSQLGGSAISKTRINLSQSTSTLFGAQLKETTNHGLALYDLEIYGNKKGLRAD